MVKGKRSAWFDGGFVDTAVYDRYALTPDTLIEGPAIIEERESTTVVAPGDTVRVDEALNLRVSVRVAATPAARITAETPVAEAIRLIESDPISLEIMWSRLVTVVEEMWLTVCRTAYSLFRKRKTSLANCWIHTAKR